MSGTERTTPSADGAIKKRARNSLTTPSDSRTPRSPQGPRSPKSDFASDVAVGMVRDLTVLRETYSAARDVYTGLVARQPDVELCKRKRFFMAGYAVLIAVRTALQKKRYRLEIARQRAYVEIMFFQELRQIGADAAAQDHIDSGITGIFDMLNRCPDEQIDERLETLVEDIMTRCGASFDLAYTLS